MGIRNKTFFGSKYYNDNDFSSDNMSYGGWYIVKRLWLGYVRKYKKSIIIASIAMVITAFCTAMIVQLVEPTINQIFLTKNKKLLVIFPFFIMFTFTIKGVSEYVQLYVIKSTGQRILNDIQMDLYKHLLHSDVDTINDHSSGRLISNFTNDISLIRYSVSNLITSLAKHLLSVVFLLLLMFKLEPFMAFCSFIVFPIAMFPVQFIGRKIRKIVYQTQSNLANYTSKLDEIFQSIKVVKSFQNEKIEHQRAKEFCDNTLRLYRKNSKLEATISPMMEILNGLVISGILLYGGHQVIEGKSTPGAFFAFITAFISAYRPFKSLVSLISNLQEGLAASRKIFETMDKKPKISDIENPVPLDLDDQMPYIKYEEVFYCIQDKKIVDNVNLDFKPNSVISIVGKSGSGKTSLINLLLRFCDSVDGKISINGINIKNISIENLRKYISLSSQDTVLFDGTIRENIAYAKMDASIDEIVAASKFAMADEFIEKLPKKYDTEIGSNGYMLSGGQRQRISIARAILKASPIIIFDEATSALDYHSEEKIMQNIFMVKVDRIILIITHRVLSILESDLIVVMNGGNVVGTGKHKELIESNETYLKMYKKALEKTNITKNNKD